MTRADDNELTRSVRAAMARRAGAARANEVEVEPILNWGGFVNRSFRVRHAGAEFCVKLATTGDAQVGLSRWRILHRHLEQHYHAPAMVDWLELPDAEWAGPVFEWIDGREPSGASPAVTGELSAVLARLHRDDSLVRRLRAMGDAALRCAEVYAGHHHDRFTQDLRLVRASPPPFVSPERIAFMESEIHRLEQSVHASAAFDLPADRPIHADPWLDNVMVDGNGRMYVLDWDDLQLGDPVVDWAIALGPARSDLRTVMERPEARQLALTGAESERLALYARATLLDWMLDPLADWIEADSLPHQARAVRQANERTHSEAFARYRMMFGV